jgi:hypothetical protein
VYLVLTGLMGLAMVAWPQLSGTLRTTHLHVGAVGFFLSMVMGVAYWMMPRPGGVRQERYEAVTFYLLNGGLVLRLVVEPWGRMSALEALHTLNVVSALLQLAAMVVFAVAMQKRVKTRAFILRAREEQQRS